MDEVWLPRPRPLGTGPRSRHWRTHTTQMFGAVYTVSTDVSPDGVARVWFEREREPRQGGHSVSVVG